MAKEIKEMVKCPKCGKEVKKQGLAAHIRIKHEGGIVIKQAKPEAPLEVPPEIKSTIIASKNINYTGEDLGMADILIKAGYAQDLDELAHKNLRLANSLINFQGGKNMENPKEETFEDIEKMRDRNMVRKFKEHERKAMEEELDMENPKEKQEETFEDIEKMKDRNIIRKFKELQVKAMEEELEDKKQSKSEVKPEIDDEEKIIKQMERQIRIKTMKKALDEGEFSLGKMMEMRMMDRMFGDNTGKSSEVQALQNQLNSLQQQMQQERLVASQQLQNERVIQKIEQMGSQQPGMTAQDVLTFTSDKDRAVKEIGLQLQMQQEKATGEKLAQLQQQIIQAQQGGGLTTQRIQAFNEELKAIKSMAAEFGDKPKGAGEYISETITNIATQLQPALTKMIDQKQQQQQFPPYPQEFPLQPPQEFPQEMPQEYPHQSDLTSSEQQISDTMSDMYIKKRKQQ